MKLRYIDCCLPFVHHSIFMLSTTHTQLKPTTRSSTMPLDVEDDFPILTRRTDRPDFPEFAIEGARLRTFEDWPKSMKQTPKELADAGFFYTMKGDGVICFHCGGGLRQWDEKDIPWIEHALWYGKCNYVLLMKGPEFVTEIQEKFGKHNNEERNMNGNLNSAQHLMAENTCSTSKINNNENSMTLLCNKFENLELSDSRLCRICYNNVYNTVFIPCGHVIACVKCAFVHAKCPLCTKPTEKILRIFLP